MFEDIVKVAALIVAALLIVTPLSRAEGKKQTTVQTSKPPVANQKAHRVVLQVDRQSQSMFSKAMRSALD